MDFLDMEFSTRHNNNLKSTFKLKSSTSFASPIQFAAPPISFFINAIPEPVLIFRPPVSNETPLPIKKIFVFDFFLFNLNSQNNGFFDSSAPWPTAKISGNFFLIFLQTRHSQAYN